MNGVLYLCTNVLGERGSNIFRVFGCAIEIFPMFGIRNLTNKLSMRSVFDELDIFGAREEFHVVMYVCVCVCVCLYIFLYMKRDDFE